MGRTIVEQEGRHGDVFADGQYPGPIVEYNWPLDITATDLVFQFVRPLIFFLPGPPLPEGSPAIHQVSKKLADRLQALRQMLIKGQLVAHGTFEKTGMFGAINRLQWARVGLFIGVKNGDLLQEIDHRPIIQWSGLALEAPTPQHSSIPTLAQNETPPTSDTAEMVHVTTTEPDGLLSNHTATPNATTAVRRTTPMQASIDAAVQDLWSHGIPAGLPLKVRDQKIIDWQKSRRLAVASSKTIRRYFAAKS